MRDRLVAAFVSLTVVVLTLFVGVRAYTTAELVEAQETTSLARTAEAAATLLSHLETENGRGSTCATSLPTVSPSPPPRSVSPPPRSSSR